MPSRSAAGPRHSLLRYLAATAAGLAILALALPIDAHSTVVSRPAKSHRPAKPKPFTKSKPFRLQLSLKGSYTYDYTAPGNDGATLSDRRTIRFGTGGEDGSGTIAYGIRLYPQGKPPFDFAGGRAFTNDVSNLKGSWSQDFDDPGADPPDSCQATGGLEDNDDDAATGSGQPVPLVVTGDYGSHDYDLILHASADQDPEFTYTGTHSGADACASTDGPWNDWVSGQLKDELATFEVALTVPQSKLRAALKGAHPRFPVHLLPNGGLASTDCGSTPDVGISCVQSLKWTGEVEVTRNG